MKTQPLKVYEIPQAALRGKFIAIQAFLKKKKKKRKKKKISNQQSNLPPKRIRKRRKNKT